MTRDSQKSKVYKSGWAIAAVQYSERESRRSELMTIAQCQEYVDKALASAFIQTRWGQRGITVIAGRNGGWAQPNVISLGVWARQPSVILHEMAHTLNRDNHTHDDQFAATYLLLVNRFMGPEVSAKLRAGYAEHKVRYRTGMAKMPQPGTHPVVTAAMRQERQRSSQGLSIPVTPAQAENAAMILRRAIAQGMFGQPGRKPRTHAQSVARLLEALKPEAAPKPAGPKRVTLGVQTRIHRRVKELLAQGCTMDGSDIDTPPGKCFESGRHWVQTNPASLAEDSIATARDIILGDLSEDLVDCEPDCETCRDRLAETAQKAAATGGSN